MRYSVTTKGTPPPDLAQRIAEAHAQALKNLAQPRPQTDGQKPSLWDTKTSRASAQAYQEQSG